jgi:hypothetical protein
MIPSVNAITISSIDLQGPVTPGLVMYNLPGSRQGFRHQRGSIRGNICAEQTVKLESCDT